MSIQSITSTFAQGATRTEARRPPAGPDPMQATSERLGLSSDELRESLRAGNTLASIAEQQGVSREELLASIKDGLTANRPQGAPAISDVDATALAESIADGKRPQHVPSAGRPPAVKAPESSAKLTELAQTLDVDEETLLESLRSDTALQEIASALKTGAYGALATAPTSGLTLDLYA